MNASADPVGASLRMCTPRSPARLDRKVGLENPAGLQVEHPPGADGALMTSVLGMNTI